MLSRSSMGDILNLRYLIKLCFDLNGCRPTARHRYGSLPKSPAGLQSFAELLALKVVSMKACFFVATTTRKPAIHLRGCNFWVRRSFLAPIVTSVRQGTQRLKVGLACRLILDTTSFAEAATSVYPLRRFRRGVGNSSLTFRCLSHRRWLPFSSSLSVTGLRQ